jgi:hypothetical protein
MRTISAPIVPGSSGGVPGQTSTTSGVSAPTAAPVPYIDMIKETINPNRIIG